MTRRDLLALLAGLPLVGRLFRKPKPEPTVRILETWRRDGTHTLELVDGYYVSEVIHCDTHTPMPFVLLENVDGKPLGWDDTFVFDEAMQENDDG